MEEIRSLLRAQGHRAGNINCKKPGRRLYCRRPGLFSYLPLSAAIDSRRVVGRTP